MGRKRWFPWLVAGFALSLVLIHEIFRPSWFESLPRQQQALVWAVALLVVAALYLVFDRAARSREQNDRLHLQVQQSQALVAEAYQRLDAIFKVSQKFVEASDEREVVDLVLRLAVDLVGARGASFVPLDEHGQPATALSYGEMPLPAMTAWLEYIASPAVRETCRACSSYESLNASATCPLLKGPFAGAAGIFCLPLRRGEREFGLLSLVMPSATPLDAPTQAFLQALRDETALTLEGVRLRRRELEALRQIQSARQRSDLSALLDALLHNAQQALEADFARLVVVEPGGSQPRLCLTHGDFPIPAQAFAESMLQSVMVSLEPLVLGEVAGSPAAEPGVRALMAAPLLAGERGVIGGLLVGNRRSATFHPRQLTLLQTLASQAALVVENAQSMAELEYNVMIQERTRLAREIHDGLAQTLGFLKLQTAQMQSQLARTDLDRLQNSLDLVYGTLSEAYEDVRQAIDGLRISPDETGIAGWLQQTIAEFREASGLAVTVEACDVNAWLPPEVHAQLLRILQEGLSNVRKHAQARNVWVACREQAGDLLLEVRDDGVGFSAEDVPGPSRHGLRGMRERAELIGADFQVISRPLKGTIVRVRLPLVGLQAYLQEDA